MSIIKRRYSMLVDFQRVHDFLTDSYDRETLNSYLLPQYFEYAHHLQWFDWLRTHRFGLWEEDGEIVGIACYESNLGEVHLHTNKNHENLLPELLSWAEEELSAVKQEQGLESGKRHLKVWITDKEPKKREMLQTKGYTLCGTDAIKVFNLEPLATVPRYRRMGLATICLMEAMRKTKALGAEYCFGGSREFYTDIGFEHIGNRQLWEKEWHIAL